MPLDFKKLVCARFLFTFAVQMQAVVLGWRIYDLLKEPLSLGLIGLTEAVPALGLALYAGFVVDRSEPLKIYQRVNKVSFLSGIVVLSEHLLAHQLPLFVQVAALYSASFLTGLARSFSQPAIYASVPRMLPRNELLRGVALMSSSLQVARVAGPAAGGLIFGFFGAVASSSVVCACLLAGIITVSLIKQKIPAPSEQARHTSITEELLSGVKFVFKHKLLLPALSLDMVSVMFGGVTALLPIFANDILQVGPKGLGALRAAPAIGAAFMGFYMSKSRFKNNSGRWLLFSIAGFGICILVFGASRVFWLSMTALVLSGVFDSVSMIIRSSAVQLVSPDNMRGKISAVNSIFIGSSNELGEFESGIAAKLLGTVPAVYFGGFVCLLCVGLAAWLSPALRKLNLQALES